MSSTNKPFNRGAGAFSARLCPSSSLPGLTRQSILFAKTSGEGDGPLEIGFNRFRALRRASRINPTCVVKPAGDAYGYTTPYHNKPKLLARRAGADNGMQPHAKLGEHVFRIFGE